MIDNVVLHIGTHKTGTTSIQNLLAARYDVLLDHGFLYPHAGRRGGHGAGSVNQNMLAHVVTGRRGTRDHNPWTDLFAEVDRADAKTLVLSGEAFMNCSEEHIGELQRLLDGYPVTVVVYLRNPLDMLRSAYKQHVGRRGYPKSFREFLHARSGRVDYGALVNRWNAFGRDNLRIGLFDKAIAGGGLETDFLRTIGIEPAIVIPETDAPKRKNVGPNEDTVVAIRKVNRVFHPIRVVPLTSKVHARARRHVWRRTPLGRAAMSLGMKVGSRSLYDEDDVVWLRSRVLESNRELFDGRLPAADRAYLEF